MTMNVNNEISEILELTLFEAWELQRAARAYRSRKLTREQFIAVVEEISMKIEQRIRPTWEKENIPF
jgi:hypothetical protein